MAKKLRQIIQEKREYLAEMPWVNPSISSDHDHRKNDPSPIKNERFEGTKPRKISDYSATHAVYRHSLKAGEDGTPTSYHLVNKATKNIELAVHGSTRDGKFLVGSLGARQGNTVKAHEFYHHLITKHNVHMHSDYEQSEGGMKVWKALHKMPGIHMQSFNGSSEKYSELKPSFQRKYDMDSSTRLAAKRK